MHIEEGKYYKNANGDKVGPLRKGSTEIWDHNRSVGVFNKYGTSQNGADPDLIEEWLESPVRKVTRKEIVGGQYHKIEVFTMFGDNRVALKCDAPFNAEELRAAAETLIEIADALDDKQ